MKRMKNKVKKRRKMKVKMRWTGRRKEAPIKNQGIKLKKFFSSKDNSSP